MIRVLDRNVLERGYPRKILSDNEPEFISIVLADWSEEHGVILDFTEPVINDKVFSHPTTVIIPDSFSFSFFRFLQPITR